MKPVIYLDVLIFLNMMITFLLLSAASRMMKLSPSPGRFVLGSVLGGASSLMILAPELGLLLSLLTKLLFSLIIVVAVYNPKSLRAILRETGYFFAVSFLFAGIMLGFSSLPGVSAVQVRNGAVYVNFSFFSLIAASVLCYAVTAILGKFTGHKTAENTLLEISVTRNGKTVCGQALLDTGHSLTDPFTGESVLVADKSFVKNLLPENTALWLEGKTEQCEKVRLIPYTAVGSSGLLPCFRADEVELSDGKNHYRLKNAEIAVSDGAMPQAVIPPEMLADPERSQEHEHIVP